MEFKKLELEGQEKGFRRLIKSPQIKRTLIFTVIGAAVGFLFFYLGEGQHMDVIPSGDVIRSLLIGGGFGFFITNSPCARGRC